MQVLIDLMDGRRNLPDEDTCRRWRDPWGNSLLHHSARGKVRRAKLKALLNFIDPNTRNDRQQTPLHLAAELGSVGAVKTLIGAGADVNAADGMGAMPLHAAAGAGRADVIKILLASGADASMRLWGGQTALHLAASSDAASTKAILQVWPHPNSRNFQGWYPIFAAVESCPEAIRVLHRYGAWLETGGPHGVTPVEWAVKVNPTALPILKNLGAKIPKISLDEREEFNMMKGGDRSEWEEYEDDEDD